MSRGDGPTFDGGVGLVALGGAFVIVMLWNQVFAPSSAVDVVQTGYVGLASLVLVLGGLWLIWSEWPAASQRRVLGWSLVGCGFLVVLAFLQLWGHVRAGTPVSRPGMMVLRLAVFGCVGGAATGFYQSKSRREQARAEENLERFTTLFEEAPLAVVALTGEGEVVMWNAAAESLFGYRASEVVGRPYPLVPGRRSEELAEHLGQTTSGEHLEGVRTKRRRKDGTLLDVELWATPISTGAGAASSSS